MNKSTLIYGLIDPRDGRIRYVGKTHQTLQARLCKHISERNHPDKKGYHKSAWIRCLVAIGLKPEIILLEKVVDGDWVEAEKRWIAYGRSQRWDLTNHTDGGEGAYGRVSNIPQKALDLLGVLSDTEIAKRFGVKRATIAYRRRALGIPPVSRYQQLEHTRINLPSECIEQMGKIPDMVLAERFQVSPQTIARRREQLGISALSTGCGSTRHAWTPEIIAMIGTMPDKRLARITGIPYKMINYRRNKLKIPPYSEAS